jgi:predicted  nucleic acid-binding Zn-ribbon protein
MGENPYDRFIQLVDFDLHYAQSEKKFQAQAHWCLELENQKVAAQAEVATARDSVHQEKKQAALLELEITGHAQEIRKKQAHLDTVRDAREYAALEHEIAGLQKKIAVLETAFFEIWDRISAREEALKILQDTLAGRLDALTQQQDGCIQEQKKLEQELAQLAQDRVTLKKNVTPEILALYESRRAQGDEAAAEALNGSCNACGSTLPSGDFGAIKRHVVMPCQRCRRLLFVRT